MYVQLQPASNHDYFFLLLYCVYILIWRTYLQPSLQSHGFQGSILDLSLCPLEPELDLFHVLEVFCPDVAGPVKVTLLLIHLVDEGLRQNLNRRELKKICFFLNFPSN